MPRKAKITAVPVEQPEEGLASGEDEPKPDAEQMSEIINQVSVAEPDEVPVIQAELTAPKAKAKRVSKKEPVVTEPEVEVTSSLDEDQVDVTYPVEEITTVAKVECPDCGKQMSAKTLRYSHGPDCASKKQKQSLPEESRGPHEQTDQSIIEEVIENEVQKRLNASRAVRAGRRQEMVANLMQNAF